MGYKILITPTSFLSKENTQAKERLESFADEIIYNDLGRPLKSEEILERLDGVHGYIAGLDYIDKNVIENAPDTLRVISRYGAGVDRVDLKACAEKDIIVTNTPGSNAIAVCELAFSMMLAVSRNIPKLHCAVEKGEWPRNQGFELYGKSLGIVGLGAIGKNLALRAKSFGMKVSAFDLYFDKNFAEANDIEYKDLNNILTESDYISLHIPLTEETRYIINKERISNMKKGAVIINTSRGGLIDEFAAAEFIKNGHLGGLGIDAFEQEPPKNSPLTGLDRVVMTPHTGAHTSEAVSNMGNMAVDNLIRILQNEACNFIIRSE